MRITRFSSNHSTRRDVLNKEVTGAPRKDVKKAGDKATTAKGEAHELQLKEESCIREKVMSISNIFVLLRALGEMAIANPVFTNSQLPSVKYVNPLLRSPIVGEAASETFKVYS